MVKPVIPHKEPNTVVTVPSQGASQPTVAPAQLSDTAIARAIASAVRATPGVADLNPGLVVLAATYGPNERVVGVIVRHPGPRDTVVEVHVTAEVETLPGGEAQGGVSDESTGSAQMGASDAGVLTRIADRVRGAVYRAVRELGLEPPSAVDVLIDDIQLSA